MPHSGVRYSTVAIALHWLIAVLMIPMLLFGEELMEEDGGTFLPSIHVSIGVSILVLTILRLVWRIMNPPPPPPATMAAWEKAAATATHVLFYVLMVGLPLSGWLLVPEFIQDEPAMAGIRVLGLFPVPAGPNGGEVAGFVHEVGSKVGIALVALHVIAALKHQFLDRDGTLRRMSLR